MQDITNSVAVGVKETMRQWQAVDGLIANAPVNCTKIELTITPDGHSVSYFTPSQDELARFSWKSVHGEWLQ